MKIDYKIICGDCLEEMKKLPDNSIDLTVTSPPYDNLRLYNGFVFDFQGIAKELYRITQSGGVVVWVVGDATINGSETGTSFKQALFFKEIGFNLHDTMIYFRHSPPLTHRRYEQHFEFMFVLSKGPIKTFNPLLENKIWQDSRDFKNIRREKDGSYDRGFVSREKTKIKGNVWQINAGGGHCTKDSYAHTHPAIFPEQLANDHIISWSNKGDTVFDPFLGSGTTGKMSVINKRHFIGVEISSEYCEIAEARIKRALCEPCDIPQRVIERDLPLFSLPD